MKTNMLFDRIIDSDWGCFGNFDTYNPVCRKRCALRLRCIVAREKMRTDGIIWKNSHRMSCRRPLFNNYIDFESNLEKPLKYPLNKKRHRIPDPMAFVVIRVNSYFRRY